MKKWWESPTAALGALCGEKAEEELREALQSAAQAEYQRGYEDGKESAVVHAHWEHRSSGNYLCSNCHSLATYDDENEGDVVLSNYCHYCGAKMDEVQND